MGQRCIGFAAEQAQAMRADSELRRCFMVHLVNLWEFNIVTSDLVDACMVSIDAQSWQSDCECTANVNWSWQHTVPEPIPLASSVAVGPYSVPPNVKWHQLHYSISAFLIWHHPVNVKHCVRSVGCAWLVIPAGASLNAQWCCDVYLWLTARWYMQELCSRMLQKSTIRDSVAYGPRSQKRSCWLCALKVALDKRSCELHHITWHDSILCSTSITITWTRHVEISHPVSLQP